MKIYVTGAPGSNKSAFAKSLAKQLRKYHPGPHPRKEVVVIDGYVEELQKRNDLAYGIHATLPMNFQVASARLTAEQEAEVDPPLYTIVVGSIFDTIVYNTLRINRDLFWKLDDQNAATTVQIYGKVALEMLGVFVALTLDPEAIYFHVPLDAKRVLELGKSYEVAVDKMVPECLGNFKCPVTLLDGPTKQRLKDALTTIAAHERRKATESSVLDQSAA